MSPAPRLGPMHLKWCDACNIPYMAKGTCAECGGPLRRVSYTPPGDVRFAFGGDLGRLRDAVAESFNGETAERVLSLGPVLLNPAPSEDRLDEVIVGGMVVGALRSVGGKKLEFLPRGEFARLVVGTPAKWVAVDDGAVAPILESSNLLGVGVTDASSGIFAGDQVSLLSSSGEIIAFGASRRETGELLKREKGLAVKVHHRAVQWTPPAKGSSVERVLKANSAHVEELSRKALDFIKRECGARNLPVLVSYSGGKDSLATLDLVRSARIPFRILFVDTGLEFPEVLEDIAALERQGVAVIRAQAGDAFWRNLPSFGPPGRDFRWCCKTCKLGPVTLAISREASGGALSFIGQRRYESEQRAGKGSVWENPWTPGQHAASPVQEWTAFEVWLYILHRGLKYSSLYDEGMERIGCWLCPASSLYEFSEFGSRHPDYGRFAEFVKRYCEERGIAKELVDGQIWRWREKMVSASSRQEKGNAGPVLVISEGYAPCTSGLTAEGMFTGGFDMDAVKRLLPSLGKASYDSDGIAKAGKYIVFPTGEVVVYAENADDLALKRRRLEEAVLRAHGCTGCGVCIGRCPSKAITISAMKATIDPVLCTSCGTCLDGPCVATAFRG